MVSPHDFMAAQEKIVFDSPKRGRRVLDLITNNSAPRDN
jgi:hypothetical protein